MPQLPLYQERVGVSGAPRFARAEVPDNSGQQAIAQSLGRVADNVQAVQQRDAAVEASNGLSSLRMRAMELFNEAQGTAAIDGKDFTPQVMQSFEDDLTATLERTSSKAAKQLIRDRALTIKEQLYGRASEYEVGVRRNYLNSSINGTADKLSTTVQQDPDSWRGAGEEQILAIEAMQLPPEERLAARAKIHSAVTTAAALGYAQRNPVGTLKRLADPSDALFAGLSSKARAAVTEAAIDTQRAGLANIVLAEGQSSVITATEAMRELEGAGLDLPTLNAVRKQVQEGFATLRAQRREEMAEPIADLHSTLAAGVVPDDADRSAFTLYDRGALTKAEYASLRGTIANARQTQAAAGVDATLGQELIHSGTAVDPQDPKAKRAIDAGFGKLLEGVPRGTPEWRAAAVEVLRKTGVAPAQSLGWARAQLNDSVRNPQGAAEAAYFLDTLQRTNGAAFGDAIQDDNIKAFAHQVSDAVRAGADPVAAVADARHNVYELTDAMRAALKIKYTKELKSEAKAFESNMGALRSRLDSDSGYDPKLFPNAPATPLPLQAEFNAGVQHYYQLTGGNLEQAREQAWRDVKKSWGYSTVNGTAELMRNAPETRFPLLPVELIRADLRGSVDASELGAEVNRNGLVLVQSPDTEPSGGLDWFVGVRGDYGEHVLLKEADGQNKRYRLPADSKSIDDALVRAKAQAKAQVAEEQARNDEAVRLMEEERIRAVKFSAPFLGGP